VAVPLKHETAAQTWHEELVNLISEKSKALAIERPDPTITQEDLDKN